MLARNTILENRYRIVRPLGKGGMGQVYEAIDDTIDSIVAIKETLEFRDAFRQEAKTLANLKHPALPRVTHHFFQGDGQFLVMEFIEGLNLAQRLELRGRPFGYGDVLTWVDKLLGALIYLHDQKPNPIIHRDIKPANIKVTSDGEVYLLDFGLAKGAPGQAGTSLHAFTMPYASLEQLHHSGTTPQSDIYSLGATLYHLLTGDVPIPASHRFESLEESDRDPLASAHDINSAVPRWLSEVISKSMAIRRRDRFGSAKEMRQALAAAQQKAMEAETQKPQPKPVPEPKPEDKPLEKKQDVAPPQKTIPAPHVPQPPPPSPAVQPSRHETTDDEASTRPSSAKWVIPISVAVLLVSITVLGIVFWPSGGEGQTQESAQPPVVPEKTQPVVPTAPAGMVYVPGGEFTMGRDDGDEYERPAHKVTVKPFFIDIDEVTNEDYWKYFKDFEKYVSPHRLPTGWTNSGFPPGSARRPVTGVTWDDANHYAEWAGKRLPTEEEWEFAARGTDGRRYPWGNEWQGDRANANSAKTDLANVGSSKGVSPFGLDDMVGNAWEWTASSLTTYPGGQLPIKPTEEMRVIRGGAYDSDRSTATATYRRGYPARGNYDYSKTGFRCAKDVN